jgi:hypothetical protein
MSNNNGYAENRRLLLGLGDIYLDKVFVGNLKKSVVLNIKRTYAYQRAGNNIADQKGEVTGEEVTLEAEVCDFKLSQLRKALGINQAGETAAKTLRKREVVQLVGTTAKTMSETVVAGTMIVSSLTRKSGYVQSADWTITTNNITRVAAGKIASGQFVIAEYNFSDAGAAAQAMGGETTTPNIFDLLYVYEDSTGKRVQLEIYKAMVNTDFEIAFNERESGDYTVYKISFKALVDTSKPEGKNLLEFVQEDATA